MSGGHARRLELVPGEFRVVRLPPGADLPGWAAGGPLSSVTRTTDELSILCAAEQVPAGVERGPVQRALRVAGTLDFALTGVLVGLAAPLADAGIPVFVISTFDTDYLLVPAEDVAVTVATLRDAGYEVIGA